MRLEARVEPAAGAPLRVRADIGLVERVLDSLVENALRHTPAGGSVTIDAGAVRRPRAAASSATPAKASPPPTLPGIFDRYYRAERIGGASRASGHGGLGLAIARRIVDLHGGELRIDSSRPGAARASASTCRSPSDGRLERRRLAATARARRALDVHRSTGSAACSSTR